MTASRASAVGVRHRPERRILLPHRIALPSSFVALRALTLREIGGQTMGTTWSVKLAVPVEAGVEALRQAAERELALVVEEMSTWEPASRISRFNGAEPGTWHALPDAFFDVLSAARGWAEQTGGAYDPAIGTLVNAWGFGARAAPSFPPSDADVVRARTLGGWRRLRIDADLRRVYQPGGLELDLSSIAKGYAVDRVARAMRRARIRNCLVEIGGELRGEGLKPDGTPWWIALECPRGRSGELPETLLALSGLSVATSGDEQRYVDRDGRRFAHTIDPRTGAPLDDDLASVTVVAQDCMTADALATAILVLGPRAGPEFAARHEIAARFVSLGTGGLSEQLSPALGAMLG